MTVEECLLGTGLRGFPIDQFLKGRVRGAFQPKAHFWGDRFEDVGGKLLDLVRLEVSYLPDPRAALRGDSRRVRCTGRLDARPDEMAYEETS